jgi:hypothetical protein
LFSKNTTKFTSKILIHKNAKMQTSRREDLKTPKLKMCKKIIKIKQKNKKNAQFNIFF